MSQKPAITSLVSVKGPSVTWRFPSFTLMRNPFDVACSPSANRKIPAFFISSLYFLIAVTISVLGTAVSFSSGSGGHGNSIMNRIFSSPLEWEPGPQQTENPSPIMMTNDHHSNRHLNLAILMKLLPQVPRTIHRFALPKVFQLKERADFDLGIVLETRLKRDALGPLDSLFFGFHLDNPIAGDEFFGLRKRTVDYGPLAIRELDPRSLGTGLESRKVHQHSGLHQLLVVLAHSAQQLLARHFARL